MSKQALSRLLRRWAYRVNRPDAALPRRKTRLGLELFEDRVVPANPATTMPAVSVAESRAIAGGFQAQIAVDPTNPNKMVVVSANGGGITGRYSLDGGLNWVGFDAGNTADWRDRLPPFQGIFTDGVLTDGTPLSFRDPFTRAPFAEASSPSVAFARNGDVYVSFLLSNTAKNSGLVAVASFDFSGLNPVPLNTPVILYRWAGQDQALNPFIAVDNSPSDYNTATPGTRDPYVDPDTTFSSGPPSTMVDKPALNGVGGRQSPIYVAWNTNYTLPVTFSAATGAPTAVNPAAIMTVESSDRAGTFTTPVLVNNSGFFATLPNGQPNPAAAPQIFFSVGETNPAVTNLAGQMTFAWQSITTAGNFSTITLDTSRPDDGNLNTQVGAGATFSDVVGRHVPDALVPPPPPPNSPPVPPLPDIPGRLDVPENIDFTTTGDIATTDVITDLNFTMAMRSVNMNEKFVALSAPDGSWIDLVDNRNDGFGNDILLGRGNVNGPQPSGLPAGSDLGVINGFNTGLTFDDESARYINDVATVAPYTGTVKPEGYKTSVELASAYSPFVTIPSGLAALDPAKHVTTLRGLYAGKTAAALSGQWVITIFDVRRDNRSSALEPLPQGLNFVKFQFSSQIQNVPSAPGADGFGVVRPSNPTEFTAFGGAMPGAVDETYPIKDASSPTLGLGPTTSYAIDNSLGSFSPYSGRLYAAYASPVYSATGQFINSDVYIRTSDANGAFLTWSDPVKINNDSATDNFTEGNRNQFMPTITVDPVTGTVVAMWYDARNDASNARFAQYMSVSTDGGATWSDQTYIGIAKTAVDAIKASGGQDATVNLEPVPGNLANAGTYGFGIRQGLAAYGGRITPVWASNFNTTDSAVYTATVKTAAGPRIVSSDVGTVNSPVTINYVDPVTLLPRTVIYNDRFAADGARIIDGFKITFDRPIDVSTFGPNDVTVLYRDPNTPLASPGSVIAVQAVLPLDTETTFRGVAPDNATQFFVRFTTPQSAVGTYSYAVSPFISDRIRTFIPGVDPLYGDVTLVLPIDPGDPNKTNLLPRPFTGPLQSDAANSNLPLPDFGTTTSTINIPQFPVGANVGKVIVDINSLTFPRLGDLQIDLVHNGTTVNLVTPGTLSGADLALTRFDDAAATSIAAGTAPYTGSFKPLGLLAAFTGAAGAGNWDLVFRDTVTGQVGTLRDWDLILLPDNNTAPVIGQNTTTQPVPDIGYTRSDITVPNPNATLPAGASPIVVGDVVVDLNINQPNVGDLIVYLFHTDPTTGVTTGVRLINQEGGSGNNFTGLRLDDNATRAIQSAAPIDAPFTGSWRGEVGTGPVPTPAVPDFPFSTAGVVWPAAGTLPLAAFKGLDPTGTWSLVVRDRVGQNVGSLVNWSLTILPGHKNSFADQQPGNSIDQNADARPLEFNNPVEANTRQPGNTPAWTKSSDVYSVPIPVGGVPFTFPYVSNTLPLSETGPFVLRTQVANQVPNIKTVTPNVGFRTLNVTFDRVVDPTTFSGADIVRITDPSGNRITGPFTITPTYPGLPTPVRPGTPTATFRITFANSDPVTVGGTYIVTITDQVFAADNVALNNGATALIVTFSRDIDVNSFTPADVVGITGPLGPIALPAGSVTVTPIGPVNGGARQFTVTFPGQSLPGSYSVQFGSNIHTTNQSQWSQILPAGTTTLTITFDTPVPTTGQVTPADLLSVYGPSGLIPKSQYTVTPVGVVGTTTTTYKVTFLSPIAAANAGQYQFDFSAYNATVNATNGNLGRIPLSFGNPVALTAADITSVVGPNGPVVLDNGNPGGTFSVFQPNPADATQWVIQLPDQIPLVPGTVQIPAGNYSVYFRNGVFRVTIPSQTGSLASASTTLDITFPNAIASLPLSQISRVIGPNGKDVNGPTSVAPVSPDPTGTPGRTWRLTFPDQDPTTGANDPLPVGTYTVVFTTGTKLDINWNAGLDILKGGSAISGAIKTVVHTSTAGPITIPAGGSAELPLVVPESFAIQNDPRNPIEVLIGAIQYPDVRNIDIDLVAPDGTTIRLFTGNQLINDPGTQTANFINTRLLDAVQNPLDPTTQLAVTPILSALPPFNAGSSAFSPQQQLTSPLVSKGMNGTWKLRVTNNDQAVSTGKIVNWTLTLPYAESNNGLGEPYADRFTGGFQVFNMDPTNVQSQDVWSPVGASPTNPNGVGNTGRASALAVDSSDPSGNTVYVGGASGGIWRTTDFLTQKAGGPTWVPLLDFSMPFALNIGSIALFPRNGDTNQTVVYALTGEGNSQSPGIGVLRSMDAGKTWVVLDSRSNVDQFGNILSITDGGRDRVFSGATGYKIVIDPNLSPSKQIILYMAVSSPTPTPGSPSNPAAAGIWRSTDGGDRWVRLQAGQATDVILSAGSAGSNGNLLVLYGAIQQSNLQPGGVYFTSQAPGAAVGMTLRSGGVGTGVLIQKFLYDPFGNKIQVDEQQVPVAVGPSPGTPGGRITLAAAALTNNPLYDSFYSGWLYAISSTPAGQFGGLYQTKDFGLNWTRIDIPQYLTAPAEGWGSNNETRPDNDIFDRDEPANSPPNPLSPPAGVGNQAISLTLDPTNPNIVYLGGLGAGNDVNQPAGGLIRVDATKVNGSETFVFHDESAGVVGAVVQLNTNGGLTGGGFDGTFPNAPDGTPAGPTSPTPPYPVFGAPNSAALMKPGRGNGIYTYLRSDGRWDTTDFLNLARDPSNPFLVNSTMLATDLAVGPVGSGQTADGFTNNGENASWRPFTEMLQSGRYINPANGAYVNDVIFDRYGFPFSPSIGNVVVEPLAYNVYQLYSVVDPLTGQARLLAATEQGVYTGVDRGDGRLSSGVGFLPSISRGRNGNLQLGQYFSGAVQPSQSAADVAGAMFYAMSRDNGFPVSAPDILQTGNTAYSGQMFDVFPINGFRSEIAPELRGGSGTGVAVDATGSGSSYQYRQPAALGNGDPVNDFFRYFPDVPGVSRTDPTGGGISRIGQSGQLVRGNGVDSPFDNVGQWPIRDYNVGFFGVNPIDPNAVVLGSVQGRVYRTTDAGLNWFSIGEPNVLDGTTIRAAAFGAPNPNADPGQVNNFIYVGTLGTANAAIGGKIFVTRQAGVAAWTDISAGLDASAVMQIIPNPRRGSTDAFAITQQGVYYKSDAFDTQPWQIVTGNLFALQTPVFGSTDPKNQVQAIRRLNAMAIDWRFSIKIDSTNPASPTRPEIYVAGDGGVFKLDTWKPGVPNPEVTWKAFPAGTSYTDQFGNTVNVPAGGNFPDVNVTDLDLSTGNVDRATGLTTGKDGLNLLLATTFGRGQWAIRLNADQTNPAPVPFVSGPKVLNILNQIPANSTSTNRLVVQFDGPIDPATFTTADVRLLDSNGNPVTITGVDRVSQTPVNGSNPNNLFEISFTPQNGTGPLGPYTLTVGYSPSGVPGISNAGGNLMNQDGDQVNGEAVVDQYNTILYLNGQSTNNLVISGLPAVVTAGTVTSLTVTARDQNGATMTSFNGVVTITSSDTLAQFNGGVAPPWQVTLVSGVGSFNLEWRKVGVNNGLQNVIATPANPALINPGGAVTTVRPDVANRFDLSPISTSVTAGGTVSYTLSARDKFNNVALSADGPVTITAGPGRNTLSPPVTLTNGQAAFGIQFFTSGPQTVNVSGTGGLSATGTVNVNAGPVDRLNLTLSATSYVLGNSPITATVRAFDVFNNPTNPAPATLSLSPGDPAATITPATATFSGGVATFNVTFGTPGSYTLTASTGGLSQLAGPVIVTLTPPPPPVAPPPPPQTLSQSGRYAVGSSIGGSNLVRVFNPDGSTATGPDGTELAFDPFPAGFNGQVDPNSVGFTGGYRVATGDVNGDGVDDIVVGSGPTITSVVRVFDGVTGAELLTYVPFGPFIGGVFVATGDVNKDGKADIIITPDLGGGPRVQILRGGDFAKIADFFGIRDVNFRGGARAAAGDINGDGFADVVVSAGYQGGPRISIWDGKLLAVGQQRNLIPDFFIFESALRNGAYVGLGDINGDGFADLIGGAGPGGGPRVRVLDGKSLLAVGGDRAKTLDNFFAGNPDNRAGIRVTTKNLDKDKFADLMVGDGDGAGSLVTAYRGSGLATGKADVLYSFDAFPGLTAGVYVG